MTLSEKVKELLDELEQSRADDVVWRGQIEDAEWKILIHRLSNSIINITIKQRGQQINGITN
jgi:hypothetical protein